MNLHLWCEFYVAKVIFNGIEFRKDLKLNLAMFTICRIFFLPITVKYQSSLTSNCLNTAAYFTLKVST